MVSIGRVEPGEHPLADVGLVVAVDILEENQVGNLGDQDSAVDELESRSGSAGGRRRRSPCRPCHRRRCLQRSAACRSCPPWASSAGTWASKRARAAPWRRTTSAAGLASSGNSFSEANRLTFRFLPIVICLMASSPERNKCSPFGPAPGLLVLTGMNGGVFESSTVYSLPCAAAQIALSRLAVLRRQGLPSRVGRPPGWSGRR